MSVTPRRLPVLGLTACLLGLALSPLPFLAIGALSQFAPVFGLIVLPPLGLACGFLLWRFLAPPRDRPAPSTAVRAAEALSWTAVAAFLFIVSRIGLANTFERVGAVCVSFLVSTAACLPLVAVRRTALERRLDRLSSRVAVTLLAAAVLGATLVAALYLRTPPLPEI